MAVSASAIPFRNSRPPHAIFGHPVQLNRNTISRLIGRNIPYSGKRLKQKGSVKQVAREDNRQGKPGPKTRQRVRFYFSVRTNQSIFCPAPRPNLQGHAMMIAPDRVRRAVARDGPETMTAACWVRWRRPVKRV